MKTAPLSRAELISLYAEHVGTRPLEPATLRRHRFCLGLFLDFVLRQKGGADADLCAAEVTDFCIACAAAHNVDSRRHLHTTLRRFLAFAHERQWIGADLSAAVPSIRLYRLIPSCIQVDCN